MLEAQFGDVWDAVGDGASAAGGVVCDVVNSMPGTIATNAFLQYGLATQDQASTGAAGAALLARALCAWAGKGPTAPGATPGTVQQFPPGSIYAYDPDLRAYRVAVPFSASYSQYTGGGMNGLNGPFPSLPGADLAKEWNERLYAPYYWQTKYLSDKPYRAVASKGTLNGPPTHYEIATPPSIPMNVGIQQVSLDQYLEAIGKTPWYKDTTTWLIAGGGVAALILVWKLTQKKES